MHVSTSTPHPVVSVVVHWGPAPAAFRAAAENFHSPGLAMKLASGKGMRVRPSEERLHWAAASGCTVVRRSGLTVVPPWTA